MKNWIQNESKRICLSSLWVLLPLQFACSSERLPDQVSAILVDNCIGCHDDTQSEAGIDLTKLLHTIDLTDETIVKRWTQVERVVSRGEMPPESETQLMPKDTERIKDFYRDQFILRNGQAHFGTTPLRRLTRYELHNTLEDLLLVDIKDETILQGTQHQEAIISKIPADLPGNSGFNNDGWRLASLNPPLREIADTIHLALEDFAGNPEGLNKVFGLKEIPTKASPEQAKLLILNFTKHTCRCSSNRSEEIAATYHSQYLTDLEESGSSERSLLSIFERILISPDFLYRIEASQNSNSPYPIQGIELATRLSYFLWSSTPDDELLRLAADDSLLKDDVLTKQIERLLNSPKRVAISENFAAQWLGFNELITNTEYMENEKWNRETYDEALYFFDELIRGKRSLLDLVSSNWIYRRGSAKSNSSDGANISTQTLPSETYATIFPNALWLRQQKPNKYKPPNLIQVTSDREGGLITSPAIMRLTASKNRTSPIRRGVWILENLVGKQLEPPPNIPSLEEAKQRLPLIENPSVAQLLQQHVSQPQCVACHQAIDPLGLGLENYSSNGDWRTQYPNQSAIESVGIMPNGKRFSTPKELKQILLDIYRDEIAMNALQRLYAYAMGREVQPFDRDTLNLIMDHLRRDNYRLTTAIKQIALSKPFRHRQDR